MTREPHFYSSSPEHAAARRSERRFALRYLFLTVVLCAPLVVSFLFVRNVYPVAAWNVMLFDARAPRGRVYYVLRGETVGGETHDIAPISLMRGMYARTWWMVGATADNKSFNLRSLHPTNARMLAAAGDAGRLPRGVHVPDLIRVWGELYNERQPAGSTRRLKSIRLDAYRWDGAEFDDYEQFIETWRAEL